MKLKQLLANKNFLPLFIAQFTGAFNDNIYKYAVIIVGSQILAHVNGDYAQQVIILAPALFILPFLLFSAISGTLADKFPKHKIIQIIKAAELAIMCLGTISLYLMNISLLLATIFLLGIHSTFLSPVKYAIIPEYIKKSDLINANALIEASTFVAILLGMIFGGIVILMNHGEILVSIIIILTAIIGLLSSFKLPKTTAANPKLPLNINIIADSKNIISQTKQTKPVFYAAIGLAWFTLIAAIILPILPTMVSEIIQGEAEIITFIFALFALGIGLGSMSCNRLLKGKIQASYVPVAALAMSLFTFDIFLATEFSSQPSIDKISLYQFLSTPTYWRISIDLFLLAFFGGIFNVPLFAIMQHSSNKSECSRNMATYNILSALFMVLAAAISMFMLYLNFSIPQTFLCITIGNTIVGIIMLRVIPYEVAQLGVRAIFTALYRVKIDGWNNYQSILKNNVIIIANHTSWLDAALLAAYLPNKLTFAIDTYIAQHWFIKFFIKLNKVYPIDSTKPIQMRGLIECVKKGEKVVIFPEGRLTVTGSLMKLYEGPGMIAEKANAKILPISISGVKHSPLTRLRGKVKTKLFPSIELKIFKPTKINTPDTLTIREKRAYANSQLYKIMTNMMYTTNIKKEHLFISLISAAKTHGKNHKILEDILRKPCSYNKLIKQSIYLSQIFKQNTEYKDFVGLLLPNSITACASFFGLHAIGRVPVILNFSAGPSGIISACKTAKINLIYTSKQLITHEKLDDCMQNLINNNINIVYLDDLHTNITLIHKFIALLNSKFPRYYYNRYNPEKDYTQPAVVLFTSGSSGTPKGVVLSHYNLQANITQINSVIDFNRSDIVFNPLPIFHAFGLTGGMLAPILGGVKTIIYPNPLHYRAIPELIYGYNATILFATDTLLSNYAKYGTPYDFYSLRHVITGAEKLQKNTYRTWTDEIGIRILEGYGLTETSPVISCNTPMQYKYGSVGQFVPGVKYKLTPVPDLPNAGKLHVSGANIMLGYLISDKPGKIQKPKNGWHDTGDIVHIDEKEFVYIKGRAKRFAKIAGEMVSLTQVESAIKQAWPDFSHAVIALPDEKKGEQLLLITEKPKLTQSILASKFKEYGLSILSVPKQIKFIKKIPRLGSGKTDYQILTDKFK